MQPNTDNDDRSLSVPSRDDNGTVHPGGRDAATRIMREQIDKLYDQPQNEAAPQEVSQSAYARTHDEHAAHQQTSHEWQRYHSAWQQYYQQYYERYYMSQLDSHRKRTTGRQTAIASVAFPVTKEEEPLTKEKATNEIRTELLDKVKTHSTRVRKSRHFLPIASALVVMALFLVLQYNRVLVAQVKAYVSPGAVSPQNIIIDPNASVNVGPEPKLIIPKINVEAPIVYGITSLADAPVQVGLKDGVVHYPIPGADSMPGEKGNSVILGHSSNDVFDDGNYKFIFVQLDQLQKGDIFYINHEGKRYTYSVTAKEVILPTQVTKLILPQDKPVATLVTCVPIGTALKRLVIYADQISPDPAAAGASTGAQAGDTSSDAALPGNSPTLFDRLFN